MFIDYLARFFIVPKFFPVSAAWDQACHWALERWLPTAHQLVSIVLFRSVSENCKIQAQTVLQDQCSIGKV